jgi:hypothetical protein
MSKSLGTIEDDAQGAQTPGPGIPNPAPADYPGVQVSTNLWADVFERVLAFLKTPTGAGEISAYVDHPMNPGRSEGLAQILRGLTGFAGNLRLAVIDLFMRLVKLGRERRGADAGAGPA